MITVDKTTQMMIEAWSKHQEDKPTSTEEDLCNEYLRRQMDAWQGQEDGWRLLVGVRLAAIALRQEQQRVSDE